MKAKMKIVALIILTLALAGCKEKAQTADTPAQESAARDFDFAVSRAEKEAPELLTLARKVVPVQELYDKKWDSEVGKDNYFALYATILQRQNELAAGERSDEIAKIRDDLNAIYRRINRAFGLVVGGGTYFGHEYEQIPARTEYDIHRYLHDGKVSDSFLEKTSMSEDEARNLEISFWTVASTWRRNLSDGHEDNWLVESGYGSVCNAMYEIKRELLALETSIENEFYKECAEGYISWQMLRIIEEENEE